MIQRLNVFGANRTVAFHCGLWYEENFLTVSEQFWGVSKKLFTPRIEGMAIVKRAIFPSTPTCLVVFVSNYDFERVSLSARRKKKSGL